MAGGVDALVVTSSAGFNALMMIITICGGKGEMFEQMLKLF